MKHLDSLRQLKWVTIWGLLPHASNSKDPDVAGQDIDKMCVLEAVTGNYGRAAVRSSVKVSDGNSTTVYGLGGVQFVCPFPFMYIDL